MQEFRRDGTDALTERAGLDDIKRALADPRNERVTLHMPGSVIERWKNGARFKYRVEEDGSLTQVFPTIAELGDDD